MIRRRNVAFLLDSHPQTWTSQEDRHVLLCKALAERGHRAVLVFSNDLQPNIEARLRASGADIITINYGKGIAHYFRKLGDLIGMCSIDTVHIAFFDYFGAIGWLARLHGVRH